MTQEHKNAVHFPNHETQLSVWRDVTLRSPGAFVGSQTLVVRPAGT
ncbi:hypothetical protein SAMN04488563_6521 [Jiangella alkaliphila]|uniref:Uncharacterized protein n=1 Tax=Jiangella alkaliphila TaxID=419479 RepID=A0A1H2LQL9_9ACTN|nr:hypothetical protein SAMN04488563_6521 [Jiangella alkaliphila]